MPAIAITILLLLFSGGAPASDPDCSGFYLHETYHSGSHKTGIGRLINVPQQAGKVLRILHYGEYGYIMYAEKHWRMGQLVWQSGKIRQKKEIMPLIGAFRRKWSADIVVSVVFNRDFGPVL